MPSRRNFVFGVGSILSGGSTLLGSGAFSPDPDSRAVNYVSVETQTPSVGQFSTGTTTAAEDGDTDPPDSEDDDDQQDDDQSGDGPPDGDPSDGDESDEPETGDSGGGGDGSGGSGGPVDRPSIRLQGTGPAVLDSPHVLTDGVGLVTGVELAGVNERARTYVGETSDGRFPDPPAGDRVAFLVVNDGTVPVRLGVDVDGTTPSVFGLPASGPSGRTVDLTEATVPRFRPGESIHVVVETDTTAVTSIPADGVEQITVVADPR